MTDDARTRTAAEDAIEQGRAAVQRGARDVRDVIEEVRESSSFGDAARQVGRRIRTLREERPVAFGIGVAVTAVLLAAVATRAQR